MMDLKITKYELKDNSNYKEPKGDLSNAYIVLNKQGVRIIEVKTYYTKSHTCYVQLIINDKNIGGYIHSQGVAGGYGYDKESTALYSALQKSGVIIRDLAGTGQIRDALELLALKLGSRKPNILQVWA